MSRSQQQSKPGGRITKLRGLRTDDEIVQQKREVQAAAHRQSVHLMQIAAAHLISKNRQRQLKRASNVAQHKSSELSGTDFEPLI